MLNEDDAPLPANDTPAPPAETYDLSSDGLRSAASEYLEGLKDFTVVENVTAPKGDDPISLKEGAEA